MKTLLVMRHAKSSWDSPSDTDHERPLNERGRRQAPLMGQRIAAMGLTLDAIVSSDAARAAETAALVQAELPGTVPLTTTRRLYHASTSDWSAVVAGFDDAWDCVLGVAHNPGVADLCLQLGGDGNVPTATLLRIELPSWTDLQRGTLIETLIPND